MGNTSIVTLTQSESLAPGKPPFENMVWIPGGTFLMGSDKHYPEEAPAHEVTVEGFWMDRHTVTMKNFASSSKRPTCDVHRACAGSRGLSRASRNCSCRPPWFSTNRASGSIFETVTTGGFTFPAPIGGIRRDRQAL